MSGAHTLQAHTRSHYETPTDNIGFQHEHSQTSAVTRQNRCRGNSDGSGKQAAHWVKDSVTDTCMAADCEIKFSFTERRHHCRYDRFNL